MGHEYRIGITRFLDTTMSDDKFQLTIQSEIGRIWSKTDDNEEKIDKIANHCGDKDYQKERTQLIKTVEILQTKINLIEKLLYGVAASCGGLLVKLLYDLIN